MRRAIGFDSSYLSVSKASPNDLVIIIIVIIIIIGEVIVLAHDCGIIAQSLGLDGCQFGWADGTESAHRLDEPGYPI